jgi:hypothetical protein
VRGKISGRWFCMDFDHESPTGLAGLALSTLRLITLVIPSKLWISKRVVDPLGSPLSMSSLLEIVSRYASRCLAE